MSVNHQRNWQLVRDAAAVAGLLAANVVQAADFDCKLAATKIEKLICSDATVSQLDADLGVAYRNYRLWELNKLQTLNTTEYGTYAGYEVWEKGVKAQQRRWLKEVRNACTTAECLAKVYRARITALNGQEAPLPTFRQSINKQPELCAAMLEVLNRAPREQLGACTRHDFTDSPFTPVVTEASEALQMEYEKLDPYKGNPPFAERWPAIAKRYASGQRKLFGQQADVDGDGKPEWLLEVNYPSYRCEVLPAGSREDRNTWDRDNHRNWQTLSDNQQLQHAQQYGWISMVNLAKDEHLHFNRFGQLLRDQQQWLVLGQSQMYYKHSQTVKNHISLYVVPKKPVNYDNKWRLTETCSYWYNYE